MKLKALWWYLFNKNKYHTYEILCWIKRAKRRYIKDLTKARKKGNLFPGMCFSFTKTAPGILSTLLTPFNIYNYIPEYTPKYFNTQEIDNEENGEYGYWWPRKKVKPRIEAFNKLIEVYENKLKK